MTLLPTSLERRLRRRIRQAARRAYRRLMPVASRRVVLIVETPAAAAERSPDQLYSWAVAKIGFAP